MSKPAKPIPLLPIPWDREGVLQARPNRFLALVSLDGGGREEEAEKVHVHDPGRLQELLYPGNRVLLKRMDAPHRKTKWDLIAAWYEGRWVLVHSGYHSRIARQILENPKLSPFGELKELKAEVKMGKSSMDFLLTHEDGRETVLEVKGCTLTIDGVALFPDAPTERGRRHLETLMDVRERGLDAAVLILVFRSASKCFSPNQGTDPKIATTFWKAMEAGVEVHPLVLGYDGKTLSFLKRIPVCQSP